MYRSPITISLTDNIVNALRHESENNIMHFVMDQIVTIDKEELTKALEYDRHQYEKGYDDGFREGGAQFWTPVTEALPNESYGNVLVCMPDVFPYNEKEPFPKARHDRRVTIAHYSEYSGSWYYDDGSVGDVAPIAWMLLPEPYEEEEND